MPEDRESHKAPEEKTTNNLTKPENFAIISPEVNKNQPENKMSNENNENFKKISVKIDEYILYANEQYKKGIDFLDSGSSASPEKKAEKRKKHGELLAEKVGFAESMREAALRAEPKRLEQAKSFYHHSNQLHQISAAHLENLTQYFNGGAWY